MVRTVIHYIAHDYGGNSIYVRASLSSSTRQLIAFCYVMLCSVPPVFFSLSRFNIMYYIASLFVTRPRTSHHGREIQPRRRFIVQRIEGSNSMHLESRQRGAHGYISRTQGYCLGFRSRSIFGAIVDRECRRNGQIVEL